MTPYTSGMADFDTALEECEYQGIWFADVANYMLRERECSFFICHWHLFDYLNHIHLNDVDPVCPGYDPNNVDTAMDYFRRAYQVGDRVLGRIWEAADDETCVGVLGDHGAYPDIRIANIRKFLVDQGFTVLKDGAKGVERDEVLEKDIDWEQTRAYLKDDKGFDIYINTEPGPAFDEIERELLLALRTWVDEGVGRTPIALRYPSGMPTSLVSGAISAAMSSLLGTMATSAVTTVNGRGLSVVVRPVRPKSMAHITVASSPPETRTSPLALEQCCWLDRELKRGMSVIMIRTAISMLPMLFRRFVISSAPLHQRKAKAQLPTICLKGTRWRESEMKVEYVPKIYRYSG